jgi:hypothetical protein
MKEVVKVKVQADLAPPSIMTDDLPPPRRPKITYVLILATFLLTQPKTEEQDKKPQKSLLSSSLKNPR